MQDIPGYTYLHTIYEDENVWVVHAKDDALSKLVVIKTAKPGQRMMVESAKLSHEYELLSDLDVSGIFRPCALLRDRGSLALVYDIIQSVPLRHEMSRGPLPLERFYPIAIRLLVVLHELHTRQIIHMNVRPDTVLVKLESLEVFLTGFNDAVTEGGRFFGAPDEGSPPYMAPERTQSRGGNIDVTSDLYSLGVTLYEALCGSLPLEATDPLEWAYAHKARQPVPLHQLCKVTIGLSNFVMRLLAKQPEERYSSASEAKADLERCYRTWGNLNSGASKEIALQLAMSRIASTSLVELSEQTTEGHYPASVRMVAKMPIVQRRYNDMLEIDYEQMLDMATVFKASQAFAAERDLETLSKKLLILVMECAGAQRGSWIEYDQKGLIVKSRGEEGVGWRSVRPAIPIAEDPNVWRELVEHADRSWTAVWVSDASCEDSYENQAYVRTSGVRSACAIPVIFQGTLSAVLYMENNLITNVFKPHKLSVLQMLSAQIMQVKASIQVEGGTIGEKVPAALPEAALTLRELEVMHQVAEGLTNRQIAERLLVTVDTVKAHVKSIFVKLKVNKRIQAVLVAQARELL
ncbi:protein kinase domain-containing protein [Paenibacillus agricola]|uniref:non-specific serine/threonine protein kinase n=1 Tax=Paenibacillus agricola TaxID=2716264 RepID=A0ABX0JE06_9BACL|nr:LuxR C-terminal-related transcriptional regulator [Paenibacillus agricola]NHN34762.1 protein kinase [Paenibacillus agricola]